MADEQVRAVLTADTGPFVTAMSKAGSTVDQLSRKLDGTAQAAKRSGSGMVAALRGVNDEINKLNTNTVIAGVAVTAMGSKVLRGLGDMAQAASTLNESTSKMRVVFGQSAQEIEAWAQNSVDGFGMSKRAAFDAASSFALFGKQGGLAGQDLTKFSIQLTELAADMASFANTSPEDAMQALGAGLRGEAEPLRRYNVLLDDATLRQRALAMGLIATTTQALTPQQRVLAAHAEILRQTTVMQGDWARSTGTYAQAQVKFNAALEDAKSELGTALLPILTRATSTVADLATAFGKLPGPLKDVFVLLTGVAGAAMAFGPGLYTTVRTIQIATDAWKAYRIAAVEAKVATDAVTAASMRAGGAAAVAGGAGAAGAAGKAAGAGLAARLAVMAGPAAAFVAVVAAVSYGLEKVGDAVRNSKIDDLAQQFKDATSHGQSMVDVVKELNSQPFTGPAGNVTPGTSYSTGGFSGSGAKPVFPAIDKALSDLSATADGARKAADEYQRLADWYVSTGRSIEDLNALLPDYVALRKAAGLAVDGESLALGTLNDALADNASAMTTAMQGLFGYLGAMSGLAGATLTAASFGDRIEAHLRSQTGASGAAASATNSESKALEKKVSALRKADQAEMDAEIKAARRAAQRKADRRADAEARKNTQEDAAKMIATDKAARRGEDIDGFNQRGHGGEAIGSLTKAEQKALDAKIDGIRKRHQKSLERQEKALRGTSDAGRSASASLDGVSRSLTDSTKAGRDNQAMLLGLGASLTTEASRLQEHFIALGDDPDVAAGKAYTWLRTQRDALVDNMVQWGFNRTAVEEYLETLGLTPEQITTRFKIEMADALNAVDLWGRKLKAIPDEVSTKFNFGYQKGDIWNPNLGAWLPAGEKKAAGGPVYGPGTKTSDSIPAWLSRGEFVQPASAVDHYGPAFMEAVRTRKFASGGPARPFYATARPSTAPAQGMSGDRFGMFIAPGAVTVTEATPKAREHVIAGLAEAAYRQGLVR